MNDSLTHARAMVARCEAKLAQQKDDLSKRYYELCIAGWKREIARLEREK
jgi:hypothetical protein